MRKTINYIPMVLALLLFCACDKYADVKQFMTDLSAAIEKNDTAAIQKMYPDAAKADSLVLAFDAEKAQIVANDDGSFKIDLGEGKYITILKNEGDDGMKVKSSYGLFAYPEQQLAFAKKTGQFVDSLDDISNAERLADKEFTDFLNLKIKSQQDNALKVVSVKKGDFVEGLGGPEFGNVCATSVTVTIENTTDKTIPGNAYRVIMTIHEYDEEFVGWDFNRTYPYNGKDIKPGEKQSFKYQSKNLTIESGKAKIQMLNTGEDLVSDYTPTGNEYAEYLSSKASKK